MQQHQPSATATALHHHHHEYHQSLNKPLRRSPRIHQPQPQLQPHSSQIQLVFASFDEPQPLKVCHPKTPPPKRNNNNYNNYKPLLLTSSTVRRSPRLANLSGNGNDADSGKCRSTLPSKSSGKTVRGSEPKTFVSPDSGVNVNVNGKRKIDDSIGVSNKRLKKSDFETPEFVRRSPRFSSSKSELVAQVGVKLGEKSSMKLIKSAQCSKIDLKISGSKSERRGEIEVKLKKNSPMKLIKSVECEETEFEKSKFVRRSPRFSGSKPESVVEVADKLRKHSPLKLIKSAECENLKSVRRLPRFSGSKPESVVEVADKLRRHSPLKLIKSAECEELKSARRPPRFSGSKLESVVEVGVKSRKHSPMKLIKSAQCDKLKSVRRSPRFSDSKSENVVDIEMNLRNTSPLKLIKSVECEDTEMKAQSLAIVESLGIVEEEKVLRRSPRGLPSSFAVGDDFDEIELGISPKKMKKKKTPKQVPKVIEVKSNVPVKSANCFFVGEAVVEEEALQKWGWRYQLK